MLLLKNIRTGGEDRELMLNGAVGSIGMNVDATHLQSSKMQVHLSKGQSVGDLRPGNGSLFTHPVYSFSIVLHESMGLELQTMVDVFHKSVIYQRGAFVTPEIGPRERSDFFLQLVAVYHCTVADESEPLFSRQNYDRFLISAGLINSFQFDVNHSPQSQGCGRLEFTVKDLRLDAAFSSHMNRDALKDTLVGPRSNTANTKFGR